MLLLLLLLWSLALTAVFKLDVTCKRSGDKVVNDKGEQGLG